MNALPTLDKIRKDVQKILKNWRFTHRVVAGVLCLDEVDLLAHGEMPVSMDGYYQCLQAAQRLAQGEPLAYVLGKAAFMGLDLEIVPGVFIPRPDTQCVVEAFLKLPLPAGARVLDVGTGSGCIALSLQKSRRDWWVVGCDRSWKALQVARRNARRYGFSIPWIQTTSLACLAPLWDGLVSNPPYISLSEYPDLPISVRAFEPKEALLGGEDGLHFYRHLFSEGWRLLKPSGYLVVEMGYGQKDRIIDLARTHGFTVEKWLPDFHHIPRALVCRK